MHQLCFEGKAIDVLTYWRLAGAWGGCSSELICRWWRWCGCGSCCRSELPSSSNTVTEKPVLSSSEHDEPMQLKLRQYPYRNNRHFNQSCYKRYPWLEYSVGTNDLFCFSCKHSAKNTERKGENLGSRTFNDVGVTKFKNIVELCDKHQQSGRQCQTHNIQNHVG